MTGVKGRRWGADIYLDSSIDVGAIPYKGANGKLLWLTPGAAAQVITSNGVAPAIPSYQTPSGGGGGGSGALVFLSKQTASASSALTFTSLLSSTYDTYILDIIDVITSANTVVGVQASTDNGSTWLAGTNYDTIIGYAYSGGAGNENNLSTSRIPLRGAATTLPANKAYNAALRIRNVNSALHKAVTGEGMVPDNGVTGNVITCDYGSSIKTTSAITALRVVPDSGTLTSGYAVLYGVAKA